MMLLVRPGITTGELDDAGRKLLEAEGARSAPEVTYHYPGRPASVFRRSLHMAFPALTS